MKLFVINKPQLKDAERIIFSDRTVTKQSVRTI
jgi:hypothetical protein